MDFKIGQNLKKNEIDCLDQKFYQYCSRVYQKMRTSNIFGNMFSNKSSFYQYFHEKIMILNFMFILILVQANGHLELPVKHSRGFTVWT